MIEQDTQRTPQAAGPGSRQIGALIAWLAVVFAAAAIGAAGSANAPEFYAALDRPAWAPPAGIFGPVWTLLYAMMGLSAWVVWREGPLRGTSVRPALALFLAQLAVNALWSWAFFAWQSGALALANILALDLLVMATILAFHPVRPLAAGLLLPYLGWIGFATALTYSTWQRNPLLL